MLKLKNILFEIGESTSKPLKWRAASDPARKIKLRAQLMSRTDATKTDPFKIEYLAQSEANPKDMYIITFATELDTYSLPRLSTKDNPKTTGAENWNRTKKMLVTSNIAFTTSSDLQRAEPETNYNEQFRVMATIIECLKDFIDRVEGLAVTVGDTEYTCVIRKFYIAPKADMEGSYTVDSRRGRLYKAFIEKNLSKLPFRMNVNVESDQAAADTFTLTRDIDTYKV